MRPGCPLSSAILYLAIVAIWAGVLVPRWLRPAQVVARATDTRRREGARGHGEARGEDAGSPWPDSDSDTEPIPAVRPEHDHLVERAGRTGRVRPSQRGMILQARRRMFVMISILTAGAVGMAGTHMAAWWVIVPPGMMLGGFMLVLREAARSDAARARGLAATAVAARAGVEAGAEARAGTGTRAGTGAGQAVRRDAVEGVVAAEASPAPVAEPETSWSAEIIDISARLSDQLYDQYADAAVRAVGD
jgi:hypothetical protein